MADAPNASLQANMSQALGQAPSPYQQPQVMNNPFPDMVMGQASQPQQMQQPTLSQVQQPVQQQSFPDMAKSLGINTDGLSPSKELGGLQLMKRMQGALGPDFAQHPAFSPLMKAYQAHAGQDASESAMRIAGAKAQRTLGALMGSGDS